MVLGLREFFDFNVSFYTDFLKGGLEDLQIVDKLVIILGPPVDFIHGDLSGMNDINNLAVNSPRAKLFNLGDVELN